MEFIGYMRPRICFQFPNWLQRFYRGVTWREEASSKVIYLTFDDSCVPAVTPELLSLLGAWGVHATFFCVGDNIRKYPDICLRILREGHTIGNHTFHHVAGLGCSLEDYLREVEETDSLIEEMYRRSDRERSVKLFRPPYGRMTLQQKRSIRKTHKIVLWDILTHDYNRDYTPKEIMEAIRRFTRCGSIVVFHDSIKSKENLFAVLPEAFEWWRSNGYELKVL